VTVKTEGPLLQDYLRALKAAKRMGVKSVSVHIPGSGAAIVLHLDDAYLERLERLHPPAPSLSVEEKPKMNFHW
jgi:hypothetical protein